jgi:tubulin-specific chaperone E
MTESPLQSASPLAKGQLSDNDNDNTPAEGPTLEQIDADIVDGETARLSIKDTAKYTANGETVSKPNGMTACTNDSVIDSTARTLPGQSTIYPTKDTTNMATNGIPSNILASIPVPLVFYKTRVSVQESLGTVAYCGTVTSSPTIYIGILWDDPTRGKHNGTVYNPQTNTWKRYFDCQHPIGASFVKLDKVNWGVLLTPALLQTRFVPIQSPERIAPNETLPHIVPGCTSKRVELHGEVKIRQYQQVDDLETLCLRNMNIRDVQVAQPLADTDTDACTNQNNSNTSSTNIDSIINTQGDTMVDWTCVQECRHLDLAGNLLSDWEAINRILQVFGSLESLSLALNRLCDWTPGWRLQHPAAQSSYQLQKLNLHKTNITSIRDTLIPLGRSLPCLQELSVAHCEWKDRESVDAQELADAFPNLTTLDLTACQLTTESLSVFARLDTLVSLFLDENNLESLDFVHANQWPRLQHLQIVQTQIKQEQQLEPLMHLTTLQSLHMRQSPFTTAMGTLLARSAIIARIPTLTVLNASPVSERERKDAERRWLQQAQLKRLSGNGTNSDTVPDSPDDPLWDRLWPLYKDELEASRSLAAQHAIQSGAAWTLADCIVNVTIKSLAPSSCTLAPLHRRLPWTMPVQSLYALCARHFGLETDLQVLSVQAPEADLPTVLDDASQTLGYYGVVDGATIYMDERNLQAEQDEQKKAEHKWQERLTAQQADVDARMQQQQHGHNKPSNAAIVTLAPISSRK